jgi:hypothetical protein
MVQIGGVIVSHLGGDAEIRAKEGCSHLGDELFGGIGCPPSAPMAQI